MIETKAIIEIAGYPRDHIKNTMDLVIERLKTDKDIIVKNVKVSDETQIQKVWSVFGEFDLQFENLDKFLSFCFDYTPSSIEIINPQKLNLVSSEFSGLVNDLLERLHRYHLIIANMDAENKALKFKISNATPNNQEINKKTDKIKKDKK